MTHILIKRLFTLCLIVILAISSSLAKDIKYPCILIPDSLKKNAYAVLRMEDMHINIVSESKSEVTVSRAITVLNEKGKKKAWEYLPYNKHLNINNVSIKTYNQFGKHIETYNKKDFSDIAIDRFSAAYSDNRALTCKPINNTYPYTIVFTTTYTRTNTYSIDGWYPVWEKNLSVEKSTCTLTYPQNFKVKYKEYNFNKDIEKTEEDGKTVWTLISFKALKSEPYGPTSSECYPHVSIDALKFKYDNYYGSSASWKEFGAFIGKLNQGRDELPEERKKDIDALIDTCSTVKSKVKNIYNYMQKHTRYVNISIGIGGIQTFPAKHVSDNGYGDCKALSNYMHSMLKYAGIKSYFTLVKAGGYNYYFDTTYVGHQFNHAILCVPNRKDTIWLECTSQNMPCGFLGDFTDNRNVLLITEEGGVLTKTPYYCANTNRANRITEATVEENGNCKATVHALYSGLEYDERHRLATESKDEQKKILYKNYQIPNFIIDDFKISVIDSENPILVEDMDLTLTKFASKTGSRLFLPLNVANKYSYIPPKTANRQFDVYKKSEYGYNDTVKIKIPDNFEIEALPNPISINNKYGNYESSSTLDNGVIIYTRKVEFNKGVFPREEYNEFVDFFKAIKKNDSVMAVLKQKE